MSTVIALWQYEMWNKLTRSQWPNKTEDTCQLRLEERCQQRRAAAFVETKSQADREYDYHVLYRGKISHPQKMRAPLVDQLCQD